MKVERKNVIQILSVIMIIALLIGIYTKTYNEKNIDNTEQTEIKIDNTVESKEIETVEAVNINDSNVESNSKIATLSDNSIENTTTYSFKDSTVEESKYVVYTLARVINPKDDSSNQKYRCVINKNETGSETGLVDIIIGENTVPYIDNLAIEDRDKSIAEYEAEIKVNNAGEWLYINKYYTIEFDEIINGEIREINVTTIGPATENDIENWKQGRTLNSTFLKDMETIKKSNPAEIYLEICNNYQYTWTFEQIEAFKAYVESLDEENKNKWLEAYDTIDITIGY